jgi:hypothetical protein
MYVATYRTADGATVLYFKTTMSYICTYAVLKVGKYICVPL